MGRKKKPLGEQYEKWTEERKFLASMPKAENFDDVYNAHFK